MRNKRISILSAILILTLSAFLISAAPRETPKSQKTGKAVEAQVAQPKAKEAQKEQPEEIYKQLEVFSDAIAITRSEYVDEVKSKDLIYGAMKGMLQALDKYSEFMDPDTYKEMKVETEGEFGGVGIEIAIKDEILTVVAPIEGTPAYKAGIKAGDKVVKIDKDVTRGITLLEAVKKLRGKPGTQVSVTVLRESESKILNFSITRDIIKVKSIRQSKVLEDKTGYIKLSVFQERSATDLETALAELEKQGIDSLILDLRNNPGGLLNVAADVAGKFLPNADMIVYTKGREGKQELEFKGRDKNPRTQYPLVVLVDGGSASGSEIVAGAIQDNKRGVIVGVKTFGKGSVQTVIPLSDGSAIRLTTSRYYTPNGRSIHGEGIVPDIVVEREDRPKDSEKDIKKPEEVFDKLERSKEQPKEELSDEDTEKDEYDNQLIRAIDIVKTIKICKALNVKN